MKHKCFYTYTTCFIQANDDDAIVDPSNETVIVICISSLNAYSSFGYLCPVMLIALYHRNTMNAYAIYSISYTTNSYVRAKTIVDASNILTLCTNDHRRCHPNCYRLYSTSDADSDDDAIDGDVVPIYVPMNC